MMGIFPLTNVSAASEIRPSLPPSAISLTTIPSELPADNGSYPAVVVSLIDKDGQPTAALSDVQIELVVSQQNVGSVTPSVEISTTQTYAVANFTTTDTPGSTTITATALGMLPASTAVTTVIAVGYPTQLVISAVPSTVPVGAASQGRLVLEFEDPAGQPAKAISDTPISLYSSNTNVINLPVPVAVMKQGDYLLEVNYTVESVPGPATVTASAPGFQSGAATITVQGSPPLALKLIAQPATVATCTPDTTSCNDRLVVALTDLNGNPTRAENSIQVQIRSSNLAIVDTAETVTIPKGAISAIANFTVTQQAGTATMTASAPNLQSGITTIISALPGELSPSICTPSGSNQTPCYLAIFTGPNPVLADDSSSSSVVVALQLALPGQPVEPAINTTGVTQVTLTSSVTGVGNFSKIVFSIPEGQNWYAVDFNSTFQVGSTQLTASADNFLPIQTALATFGPVPAQVIIKSVLGDLPADGNSHPALELTLEDAVGAPAIASTPIAVNLTSANSAIAQVAPVVIPTGEASILVNATSGFVQGSANVTAIESGFTTGYVTSSTIVTTVIPAPSALAAYAPPGGTILASSSGKPVQVVAIQLQDASGHPARARSPTNITLSSSNRTMFSAPIPVEINVGEDYALVPLTPLVAGTATFSIYSSGLASTSLTLTFLASPVAETITGGPPAITTAQTAVISVSVVVDGTPAVGTPVIWNTTSGGLIIATTHTSNSTTASTSSSSTTSSRTTSSVAVLGGRIANDTTNDGGASTVVFRPSAVGTVNITATIAPTGFAQKTLNFTVQVSAPPPPVKAKTVPLTQRLTTFPLVLVPIGGAGAAVAAVFVLRRRRGGLDEGEEGFDESIG